ncbi:hypothetical protein F5Y18DRAFT_202702 [Xylariaceae sp. FL1019]|nr:hypothetical protein F5Y18DRAFT_202702 [Xylariaceae sp. FL1019]
MLAATILALLTLQGSSATAASYTEGLEETDCQLKCPQSNDAGRVILPAITQTQRDSGEWENILECWSVDTLTVNMPDVENAFRLDWEKGFDATYQYIFNGPSFMPAHPAPEPSLIIMSAGIGDLRMPSGRCLRVTAGDIFFSVGTEGRQTAWWSEGTVVSDLYFKDGKIPDHAVVEELKDNRQVLQSKSNEL